MRWMAQEDAGEVKVMEKTRSSCIYWTVDEEYAGVTG